MRVHVGDSGRFGLVFAESVPGIVPVGVPEDAVMCPQKQNAPSSLCVSSPHAVYMCLCGDCTQSIYVSIVTSFSVCVSVVESLELVLEVRSIRLLCSSIQYLCVVNLCVVNILHTMSSELIRNIRLLCSRTGGMRCLQTKPTTNKLN